MGHLLGPFFNSRCDFFSDCSKTPFDGTEKRVPKKGSYFEMSENRYELMQRRDKSCFSIREVLRWHVGGVVELHCQVRARSLPIRRLLSLGRYRDLG